MLAPVEFRLPEREVGAIVEVVGLYRDRAGAGDDAVLIPEQAEGQDDGQQRHGDARPNRLRMGAMQQPADSIPQDPDRRHRDQGDLRQCDQRLRLAVAEAVIEVRRGGNTLASVSAVSLEMRAEGLSDAVVVTDPWHSFRATRMIQQQGLEAHASPTRSGPANEGLTRAATYTARETAAYLYWTWERATT